MTVRTTVLVAARLYVAGLEAAVLSLHVDHAAFSVLDQHGRDRDQDVRLGAHAQGNLG